MSKKLWEYKIITGEFLPGSKQEKELNELGGLGWELIHFSRLPDSCLSCIVLKQEKR